MFALRLPPRAEGRVQLRFGALVGLAQCRSHLLGRGADLALRDGDGRSALDYARLCRGDGCDGRGSCAASTAAGEFVREEMHHIREGKHGARSSKQAIAIGLSKARRAGVPLKPPAEGQTSRRTRTSATRAYEAGQGTRKPRSSSPKRSRAILRVLKGEGRSAASRSSLSPQAKTSARARRGTDRSPRAAAKRGAATRKRMGITHEAAWKAARTRRRAS